MSDIVKEYLLMGSLFTIAILILYTLIFDVIMDGRSKLKDKPKRIKIIKQYFIGISFMVTLVLFGVMGVNINLYIGNNALMMTAIGIFVMLAFIAVISYIIHDIMTGKEWSYQGNRKAIEENPDLIKNAPKYYYVFIINTALITIISASAWIIDGLLT